MKFTVLLMAFLALVPCASGQSSRNDGTTRTNSPSVDQDEPRAEHSSAKPGEPETSDRPSPGGASLPDAAAPSDYIRPDANQRFRNYVNNLAGPVALTSYAATAGLLTLRNSPKEWGAKSDGFARRLANVAGKNAIRSTTVYALDEALRVDSNFYRSRDRRVVVRLRNSVFSAVTARGRRGKRVIGIPAIAGGLLSEVASSSGWYPQRYDYVHGLKGGAISLGVAAGVNLLKEFVWK